MSATSDAVEAITESFADDPDDVYEVIESTLSGAGYEPLFEHILGVLSPDLLRRLADEREVPS